MDKQKEILTGEWIGSIVKILTAANKSLIGVEGKVIDETKHTFTILTLNKNKNNQLNKKKVLKKVLKKGCVFQITHNSATYNVEGSLLEKKPEERIKHK
ncbi:ribonuclease P protein subunit [Candidatus Woesearchaeota archaeon]|nr:ribonuclease P protein subunit [Candidatus Woesearchaeota archaeon]